MLQLLGMVSPILLHFALETGTLLLLCRFLVVLGAMRNMTWDFLHCEKLVQLLGCSSQHDAKVASILALWRLRARAIAKLTAVLNPCVSWGSLVVRDELCTCSFMGKKTNAQPLPTQKIKRYEESHNTRPPKQQPKHHSSLTSSPWLRWSSMLLSHVLLAFLDLFHLFLLTGLVTQIRWARHPQRCLEVFLGPVLGCLVDGLSVENTQNPGNHLPFTPNSYSSASRGPKFITRVVALDRFVVPKGQMCNPNDEWRNTKCMEVSNASWRM